MRFYEAFNLTLTEFDLSARAIAEAAGIREATISEFRRGLRGVHTDNLERLIAALPSDARQHLFVQLMVGQMDSAGIAMLLNAIASHLKEESALLKL